MREFLHRTTREVCKDTPLDRQVGEHDDRSTAPFKLDDHWLQSVDDIRVRFASSPWVAEVEFVGLPGSPHRRIILVNRIIAHPIAVAAVKLVQKGRAHQRIVPGRLHRLSLLCSCRAHVLEPRTTKSVVRGSVHGRCACENDDVATLAVKLVQSCLNVDGKLLAIIHSPSREHIRHAPQDAILSVLRLSVATQPNAPGHDVNVAQVKADMARSVPEAVVQHHLLAYVDELDEPDQAVVL
mmetsp:Transcript_37864/g.100810  ORF Transcript_37864/g.100810 Transcript_37864/m.100810 type:complete len:239 (-) Transcript_37864:490-1206(-)